MCPKVTTIVSLGDHYCFPMSVPTIVSLCDQRCGRGLWQRVWCGCGDRLHFLVPVQGLAPGKISGHRLLAGRGAHTNKQWAHPKISGHKGPPLQDQGPLQDVRPSGRCRTSGRWPLQDLRPSGRDQPLGARPARRIQASMGRLVLPTARALGVRQARRIQASRGRLVLPTATVRPARRIQGAG